MSVEYWDLLGGTTVTTLVAGSALSGLANNASVLSASSFNNIYSGGGLGGVTLCRLALSYQFGTAPTANTAINVWLVRNVDGSIGSAFEDGSSSITPTRPPDAVFQVSPDTNAHVTTKDVICPAGFLKALVQNSATGQPLGTTAGNLGLTLTPITYQGL